MLSETAKAILARQIGQSGRRQVAAEMGISTATLSLVMRDKYQASTDAVEAKVMMIYGNDGKMNCPHLGEIEPSACAENWQRAQKIRSAGNPATIKLYAACRRCTCR